MFGEVLQNSKLFQVSRPCMRCACATLSDGKVMYVHGQPTSVIGISLGSVSNLESAKSSSGSNAVSGKLDERKKTGVRRQV